MKLATILFAATAALSAVYAEEGAGVVKAAEEATTAPATTKPASDKETATPSPTTKKTSSGSGDAAPAPVPAGASPLDGLKQKAYGKDYHMPYVRVVQARVQSDKPDFVKGRFISKFGNGDLQKGYMSAMDSVNMASVEGALMFVQAEGINQNSRSAKDRCRRKNEMNYVVLYEILIAQTNETIAQYSDNWNVPEYGPMLPMDGGRCTPTSGENFPAECLMYNGVNDFPNIGPSIGAGLKNNDIRAPYPNTFWFSFPHTCPLKVWGEKADPNNACRASSRKGLCDIGKAPDGVECTFSYDILGWVPIDDVVGITDIKDPSGKPYGNFTLWCEASKEHVEFAGSDKNGEMTAGLPFWEEPLKPERNAKRASKVIELYQEIVNKDFKSIQIDGTDLKNFKALPDPTELAKTNPPCYKTVPKCNSGFGCARSGFSQICIPCKSASPDCKTDPNFKFPTLAKAVTPKKEEELKSDLGGKLGATGSVLSSNSSSNPSAAKPSSGTAASSSSVPVAVGAFATLAASVIGVFAL